MFVSAPRKVERRMPSRGEKLERAERKQALLFFLDETVVAAHVIREQEHGAAGEFLAAARVIESP